MKHLLKTAILLFCLTGIAKAQVKITADLEYDFSTGHFSLQNGNTVGMGKKKDTHSTRLFALKEGQGITVNVKNLNPLKYYTELNGNYQSLNASIPAVTAIEVNDYFKLLNKPAVATGAEEKKPALGPARAPAAAQPAPNSAIMQEIMQRIDCVAGNFILINKCKKTAKELASVFASYNNYYNNLKQQDQLDVKDVKASLKSLVSDQLQQIAGTTGKGILTSNFRNAIDVTTDNVALLKTDLLNSIDQALEETEECYDELYDLVLQNPVETNAVQEEYALRRTPADTELMLTRLPKTKKEYFKLKEWAKGVRETIAEKIWPDIAKSHAAYLFCLGLEETTNAGTFMVDDDVLELSLLIKKVTDNKELKKIDRIKIYTTGGIRASYGAGLYFSGLDHHEFTNTRSEKLEKVATLTDNNTIDSVIQNVGYTSINQTNKRKASWGAMTFLQARTNWGDGINLGGYMGIGLLLNDETRPIFSFGGTLAFGRLSKLVNLHFGVVYGKVDRLNPKYELNKAYKGDITDLTIKETHSSFLLGMTWNIGAIGKK
jgi:hypothetical protein